MIYIVDNTDGSGKLAPRLIMRFNTWTHLHLQVAAAGAAGTIRFARDQYTLMMTSQNNLNQGLKLQQSDGIKSLWWIGEFWVIGDSAQASFDLEVMQEPNAPLLASNTPNKVSDASALGGTAETTVAPFTNDFGSSE